MKCLKKHVSRLLLKIILKEDLKWNGREKADVA